jgi:hypothetical protein
VSQAAWNLQAPFVLWVGVLLLSYGQSFSVLVKGRNYIAEAGLAGMVHAGVPRVLYDAHRICTESNAQVQASALPGHCYRRQLARCCITLHCTAAPNTRSAIMDIPHLSF